MAATSSADLVQRGLVAAERRPAETALVRRDDVVPLAEACCAARATSPTTAGRRAAGRRAGRCRPRGRAGRRSWPERYSALRPRLWIRDSRYSVTQTRYIVRSRSREIPVVAHGGRVDGNRVSGAAGPRRRRRDRSVALTCSSGCTGGRTRRRRRRSEVVPPHPRRLERVAGPAGGEGVVEWHVDGDGRDDRDSRLPRPRRW